MTNNNDPQPISAILTEWTTAHLKCKCGHAWDDHHASGGCEHCNCLA